MTQTYTMEDIGLVISGADAQPLVDAINEYLSVFAKPTRRDMGTGTAFLLGSLKCCNCDAVLNGEMGSFQWGIANGEGTCCKCGWPARVYHTPKDDAGAIFNCPLGIILQYHPGRAGKKTDEPHGFNPIQ